MINLNKFAFFIFLTSLSSLCYAQTEDQAKGSLSLLEDKDIERVKTQYIIQNKENIGLDGFRVQIYNGRKDASLSHKSKFISSHPAVASYMLYEAPEYRIQVGDFRTQWEAEKFLREILEEFSGSFVVKTRIKLPELKTGTQE